jgi:hypothetical protein
MNWVGLGRKLSLPGGTKENHETFSQDSFTDVLNKVYKAIQAYLGLAEILVILTFNGNCASRHKGTRELEV